VLVVHELKKEGSIRLAGLGIFRKRKLAARVGRNPATGEQIKSPARTRLRFTPGQGAEGRWGCPRQRRRSNQWLSRKLWPPELPERSTTLNSRNIVRPEIR
jgi:hypothetical protein